MSVLTYSQFQAVEKTEISEILNDENIKELKSIMKYISEGSAPKHDLDIEGSLNELSQSIVNENYDSHISALTERSERLNNKVDTMLNEGVSVDKAVLQRIEDLNDSIDHDEITEAKANIDRALKGRVVAKIRNLLSSQKMLQKRLETTDDESTRDKILSIMQLQTSKLVIANMSAILGDPKLVSIL